MIVSDTFLQELTLDLDDDTVQAIVLHGSYVRGEAVAPYSDIDLVRILDEGQQEQKQYVYRKGLLLSISSRPLSVYRTRFARPEKAIFAIPGVREARILLDKEGGFHRLQEEAVAWTWEPLQEAAHMYASELLVVQTEIAHKAMRAIHLHDWLALADMTIDLFSAVTEAVAVDRGVLIQSGNTYFHQTQEAVGQQSDWARLHMRVATNVLSAKERGKDLLLLYWETCRLLKSTLAPEHRETIEHCLEFIKQFLAYEKIG